MTACVNNEKEIKGGVSGKVLRTVAAGVLAMSMMPAAALATEAPADGASAGMLAASETSIWEKAEITWNLDADQYGRYITDVANPLFVENIVDGYGRDIDPSDYTVLYFEDKAGSDDPLVDSEGSIKHSVNGSLGGVPSEAGKYIAVVVAGDVDPLAGDRQGDDDRSSYTYIGNYAGLIKFQQAFTIEAAESDNPFAQIDVHQTGDKEDTSFKYGVAGQELVFCADGKDLVEDTDYTIRWNGASLDWSTDHYVIDKDTAAGTYSATVYGKGDYAGAQGTVEFTIDAIDLSKDVVTIDAVDTTTGFKIGADSAFDLDQIKINGEPLMANVKVTATAVKTENAAGDIAYMPESNYADLGVVTVEVAPAYVAGGNKNVTGSAVEVDGIAVKSLVNFFYGSNSESVDTVFPATGKSFVVSEGEVFNPALLKASTGASYSSSAKKDFTYTVTKDGVEVFSYTEPGEYVLTLNAPVEDAFASAGHKVVKFTVVDTPAPVYTAMWTVDGKVGNNWYYTGKAYTPVIAVYDQNDVKAVEGEDYTVSYEKDGEAVESMVDAGTYTVKIDYADERVTDESFSFTISAAPIAAIKASEDFFAYTGEPVVPTFTANTEADFTGASVEISIENADVRYYASQEVPDKNDKGEVVGTKIVIDDTKPLKASEIVDEGVYFAKISTASTMKNFTGANLEVPFVVTETAVFTDVASDAWYADSVYKAYGLGYINGITGTSLFAPNTDIDRSQIASIMFNMAGGVSDQDKEYPTRFSDVDQAAWYAQAVSWASTYGVVNGYAGTDKFGTFDKATREQVAAMFYNYAKAMGQDVTVADEDAALAGISDADTISPWFKTAVAWAVENGVMGNGGAVNAQANITRAEVAAMAVNFQPEAL